MGQYVGIDFGTSYIRAALLKDNRPEMVPLRLSGRELYLITGQPGQAGTVGDAASFPGFSCSGVKQKLGIEEEIHTGGTIIRTDAPAKDWMASVREDAGAFAGVPVDGAVIAVPSIFTDRQRSMLLDVAMKSGFTTVKLVNDAVAALLGSPYIEQAENILFISAGAGILSVSAIRNQKSNPKALAHEGNIALGGQDFDLEMAGLIMKKAGLLPGQLNREALLQLKKIAEKLKIDLSSREIVAVNITARSFGLETLPDKSGISRIQVTREEYETLIGPRVEQMIQIAKNAAAAGFGEAGFQTIALAGATARTPLLRERLIREFGVDLVDLPDDAIVNGAAIFSLSLPDPVPAVSKETVQVEKKEQKHPKHEQTAKGNWNELFASKFNEAERLWGEGDRTGGINGIVKLQHEITGFLLMLIRNFGKELHEAGKAREAIQVMEEGLKISSGNMDLKNELHAVYKKLAMEAIDLQRYEEARAHLKAGMRYFPKCESCSRLLRQVEEAITRQNQQRRYAGYGKPKRR